MLIKTVTINIHENDNTHPVLTGSRSYADTTELKELLYELIQQWNSMEHTVEVISIFFEVAFDTMLEQYPTYVSRKDLSGKGTIDVIGGKFARKSWCGFYDFYQGVKNACDSQA